MYITYFISGKIKEFKEKPKKHGFMWNIDLSLTSIWLLELGPSWYGFKEYRGHLHTEAFPTKINNTPFREDVKIPTYKPHTNHKRSSVRSHTLAPTSICDLSHSVCRSPLTDLGHISSVTYVCHPLWFVCGHRKGILTSPLNRCMLYWGDIKIRHRRIKKNMLGNIGNLFVKCMRQVTKGHLYPLLMV